MLSIRRETADAESALGADSVSRITRAILDAAS
jgi:hypothetical protein